MHKKIEHVLFACQNTLAFTKQIGYLGGEWCEGLESRHGCVGGITIQRSRRQLIAIGHSRARVDGGLASADTSSNTTGVTNRNGSNDDGSDTTGGAIGLRCVITSCKSVEDQWR